jgi:hypothetical protein
VPRRHHDGAAATAQEMLKTYFGFEEQNMTVMIDIGELQAAQRRQLPQAVRQLLQARALGQRAGAAVASLLLAAGVGAAPSPLPGAAQTRRPSSRPAPTSR